MSDKLATVVEGAIVVSVHVVDGHVVLSTTCHDYDDYRALPAAISYEGVVYGKTGWNSDTGNACYQVVTTNLPCLHKPLLSINVRLKSGSTIAYKVGQ